MRVGEKGIGQWRKGGLVAGRDGGVDRWAWLSPMADAEVQSSGGGQVVPAREGWERQGWVCAWYAFSF